MNGINAILTKTARALAALALGCLCLLSCRKESTLGPDSDDLQQETLVTLRITAGETPAATRADENGSAVTNAVAEPVEAPTATRADSETENSGESFENYIDITRTHILFFIGDVFSEEFIPDALQPVGSSKYPTEWLLSGPIYNPPTGAFKVVILANCSLPATLTEGVTTLEDLCKTAVYTAYTGSEKTAFQPSATGVIPMYGVRTYTGPMTFRRNIATDLGQIDVLRAMAKVIIRNTSGKSLTSATLTGYNCDGTSAPLSLYDKTSDWTHANTYDQLAKCLAVHLPNEATANETSATSRSVSLVKDAASTEEVWTGYFPEYLNIDDSGTKRSDCSAISLQFSGIAKTYPIDFRYYATPDADDDGKRFDLKRNHIYEFHVTKVDAYTLALTLTVQPWTVQKFSYDYSENVSAESNGQQKWSYNGADITPTDSSVKDIYLKGGGNVTCTFKISTPVGAEWIAVFEEKTGDQNHFRFIDPTSSTGALVDRLTGTVDGNEATLTIKQDPTTTGSAKMVIYAHYGNASFRASSALGGEYTLVKE